MHPQTQDINIKLIVENKGQIPGVPRNPRRIRDERFEQLKQSLTDSPEFMQYRPLLLYPFEGKFVCVGGNQRFKACKELGWKNIPSKIFPDNTSKEKLREYASKDNNLFGDMDWDIVNTDWDVEEMMQWGTEFPDLESEEETEQTSVTKSESQKIPDAESAINALIPELARHAIEEYDKLGFRMDMNETKAKIDFIKFRYYGKHYPRHNSQIFHPQQFLTAGDEKSPRQGLEELADGTIAAERFRFVCGDDIKKFFTTSLAMSGARFAMDFPSELSLSLINEFGTNGAVLDPCSGWGGATCRFSCFKGSRISRQRCISFAS